MTNQELQNLVERWSQESFGRPFLHQAVFNRRLKTTGGRYHLGDHHIDINPLMLEEYDLATLKLVVLHELCHYHLHLTGRGFGHRDRDFKVLLMQVGGSRYAPPGCGLIIGRNRRFNLARFVCRRCGHRFEEI